MPIECPKCHQINEDAAEDCSFCNASLVIPAIASAEASGGDLLSGFAASSAAGREPAGRSGEGRGAPGGAPGSDEDVSAEPAAYLEIEGGQEIFFRGAYTTKIPFKTGSILVGRRDVMASHYPDIDLMMYRKLDPAISRRHLRFFREEGQYFVEDLCNNNATFLNDYANKLNHERRELHDGDRIFVSMSLAFLFRLQE